MSAIKIIAIDIDATLLNSNHQLTDTVKNAIKSASEKGIKVVLTSGRPISEFDLFLSSLIWMTETINTSSLLGEA